MPAKHISVPKLVNKNESRIGDPPLGATVADAIKLNRYLAHWSQQYQLFSYSMPCDTRYGQCHNDYPGQFYVILPPAPKAAAGDSETTRQLGGMIAPWAYTSATGEAVYNPTVKWQQNGGSEYTIVDTYGMSGDFLGVDSYDYLRRLRRVRPFWLEHENFNYTPDSGGALEWGLLTVENILPAAMGIWVAPDAELSYNQAVVNYSMCSPGKPIRGYESGEDQSLGELIHIIGSGEDDEDGTEVQSRRVLFQWGHPQGLYHLGVGGTYVTCFGSTDYPGHIKIWQQDVIDQGSSGTRIVYPAIIASGTGLTSSTKGYFKMTSVGTSDTWIQEIESNTVAKYDYDDNSDTLTVDFPNDTILCEMYADASGDELLIHNISIFSGSMWGD